MATTQDLFDQYISPPEGEGRPLTVFHPKAYDPTQAEDYIRQRATALGIDPETAVRVAKSEGLRAYTGDSGSSFGPYQLHYGGMASGGNAVGGLGDEFTKATGLHARDPSTWQQQVDFALNHAAKNGWGAFHGAANSGIGAFAGIGGNPPAAAQASYQPSQQPEFGSAKTTGDLFDRLGTIIQGSTPAPDIKPYEMKVTPTPASVAALPQTPGAVEASRPVDWGATRNLLSGMAFGTGPIAAGAGRAVRGAVADIADGKGVISALSNAPGYYSAGRDLATQAREEYAQANPGWSTTTDLVGGAVPALAGGAGVLAGGKLLASGAARLAPALAPAADAASAILSGQAGNFQSIPGAALRIGSLATSGAAQGAAAGAAQTGITGGTVGENAQQGAQFGAAVGVPLGLAGNILMAPTRAAVTPGMRALQTELSSTGDQLPGSVLTADRGVNMLSRAGKSPITPEVQKKVSAALESQYKRLEAVAGTPLDTTFRGEMQQLRGEISSMSSLTTGQKNELYDVIKRANSPNGNMSGRDVVGFTRASGKLNSMQSDPDLKQFAGRIQDAIWGNLERNNPGAKDALRDLRQQVAAWGQATSRAGAHSEYSQLAHAAGTGAFTGELAGNLLAGEFNPMGVLTSMAHGNPVAWGSALAGAGLAYGTRKAAGAYANSPSFGRLLMGGGTGALPNLGIPPAVQLYNDEQARRRAQ